jgi:hypothetical protein
LPPFGFFEVGVSPVNDDVTFLEEGFDQIDRPVYWWSSLDQENDLAWPLE